jgi:hypothetical protein
MDRHELSSATWIKSSHSDANGGNCIEVTRDFPTAVPVRDSKNPDGPVVVVSRSAWAAFLGAVS